jgi:hypothetical protein
MSQIFTRDGVNIAMGFCFYFTVVLDYTYV